MHTREGGEGEEPMEIIEGKPDVTEKSDKPMEESYPRDIEHREYFKKMIRGIFKKETTVEDKEVGKYHTNQDILVQPKKEGFIFPGTVIGGKQKKGNRYIRVKYRDIKGKNKEQTFPEEELIAINNKYKKNKKYPGSEYNLKEQVLANYKGTETPILVTINNGDRGDGTCVVQVIDGDNSVFSCTKEELDKYNTEFIGSDVSIEGFSEKGKIFGYHENTEEYVIKIGNEIYLISKEQLISSQRNDGNIIMIKRNQIRKK